MTDGAQPAATGPLQGVRVVDLTQGQGRFASKVLAEFGADVVRLAKGESGPLLGLPEEPDGLLSWWYDANCRSVPVELERGADVFRRLVERADVLIEDAPPGRLEALGLGVPELAEVNPRLVHVSLTPFGSTGPRAGWRSSDLVAQALAGHLSVTGDLDRPIALWGRQSAVVGGLYAAISALAGLRQARAAGRGGWVDLSLHEALISCSEHLLMYWWFPDALAPLGAPIPSRQRSLHWIRAFEVVPCARGACMVSPAAGGLLGLIAWLKERGHALDVPDEPSADELLTAGEDSKLRVPGPAARFASTPAPAPLPPLLAHSVDAIIESWPTRSDEPIATTPDTNDARPLEGLRVLDFTHVLAGPFATRILADLGADVIRIQTDERSAGSANNAFPYNVLWARGKRSIQLAMKHERALEVLRPLVEQADIVVDNFSAGVMESWGAGPEQLAEWNPSIITMSMSGCGSDGPWRDFVTYAPTVHALSGFTALTGPPGETDCGPGIAYNDHVSGLVGAAALLSAIDKRDHMGRGQHIEISQLEVGTTLIGPAIVDFFTTGRAARSAGNKDPFSEFVLNDVFRCADDNWIAVTIADHDDWDQLASAIGLDLSIEPMTTFGSWSADRTAHTAMESLQLNGVAAGIVATAADLQTDPQLEHRHWLETLDGELIGTQTTERHPGRWYSTDGRAEVMLRYGASPFLGQHNFEVFGELLGWDEAAVAEAMGDDLLL